MLGYGMPYTFYQPAFNHLPEPHPRRIGLLGGTFNPVHHWHLLTGECALSQFQLDEMHFVPNGIPPHKTDVTDAEIRYELLQAAIRPNLRFRASRCEIDRAGKSYTVETLEHYKRTFGKDVQLFFVIGSTDVSSLPTWHDWEQIFELATVLVAPRDHEAVDLDMLHQILPTGAKLGKIDCPGSAISSTMIRDRVRDGLTYRYAVTDSVWLGIRYYGLFRGPSIRTEDGAHRGLIGQGNLNLHENWALRYFKRNPVTLEPYRYPTLRRLRHGLGLLI